MKRYVCEHPLLSAFLLLANRIGAVCKFLGPSKRLPMGMCVQQCSDDIFNKIADTPRVTCMF